MKFELFEFSLTFVSRLREVSKKRIFKKFFFYESPARARAVNRIRVQKRISSVSEPNCLGAHAILTLHTIIALVVDLDVVIDERFDLHALDLRRR